MKILGLDHVQLAMPAGQEERARAFYAGALGLTEVAKPERARGGAWFHAGSVRLHLGVEADFRPARKAHPALVVADLLGAVAELRAQGYEVTDPSPFEDGMRCFVADPFGNRIELMTDRP